MTVVWQDSPVAAAQLVEKLGPKKGWQPRTVRTLLSRLVAKRALRARLEDGLRYLYEPRVSMEECIRRESQSFLNRVFGGAPASMLISLVKETSLTPGEIKELKQILSEKEK